MAVDAKDSAPTAAPPRDKPRLFNDLLAGSWRTSKRSKRQRLRLPEDEYLATCLVMLARSGGGPYPSPAAVKTSQSKKPEEVEKLKYPDFCCYICNQTIASHHELAAHRASHRTAAVYPSESENEGIRAVIPEWNPPFKPKPSGGRLHNCFICRRTFASGQALVDHKWEHSEGVVIGNGADPKPQTTSANAAVVRDFDLNMLPPEALCDEAVVGKCSAAAVIRLINSFH